jgi:hypothetical protein
VNTDQKKPKKGSLVIKHNLMQDMQWYYKLKGIKFGHGLMFVPVKDMHWVGDKYMVVKKCKLFKDNLCTGHPYDKPKFCCDLNAESVPTGKYELTPNCLFKYKDPAYAKLAFLKEKSGRKEFFDRLKEVE